MSSIKVNDSLLSYRYTPWDKKIFDMETIEILDIINENSKDTTELLHKLEQLVNNDGLIYYRLNSNDIDLKQIMISNEYYSPEVSLELFNAKIQKIDFLNILKSNLDLTSEISHKDICEIKEIAKTAFNYSRFHEDPFLDSIKSSERYENWIEDLISQGKDILCYKKNNKIYSFLFYERSVKDSIHLILGGSRLGFGQMTPFFWSSFLTFFKKQGVKKINVIVSASNITILNIYLMFGFSILETKFDFHKIIKKSNRERI